MSDAGPPLDPRVIAVLREEPKAPEDARARARARLAAVIPFASGPSPSGNAPASGASGSISGALGGRAVTALAFVLGGVVGAGVQAARTAPQAPRVVYVAVPGSAAAVAAEAASGVAASQVVGSAEVPTVQPRPAAVPSASQSAARGSQLAEERSLLDGVRAALGQGDAEGALGRLRASRREFPHAILDEEREALGVEALVAAHRYEEARAAAEGFRKSFPDSLFTPTVDAAVRVIP